MKTIKELVKIVREEEALMESDIWCKAYMSPVQLLEVFAEEIETLWKRLAKWESQKEQ